MYFIDLTLKQNENFTSAIIKAVEIAVKNAEQEKKEYLANAVVNAIDFSADESILMIYMEMLESIQFDICKACAKEMSIWNAR